MAADESFDSGMFQSKFIHCCITSICMRTLNTIDSCRLDDFFVDVDMEVHGDLANGMHLIFRFMCDRNYLSYLYLCHKKVSQTANVSVA